MSDVTRESVAATDRPEPTPDLRVENNSRGLTGREMTETALAASPLPQPGDGTAPARITDPDDRATITGPPEIRRAGSPVVGPVDGLALWDAEGGDGPVAGLTTVRLDQNERLLIPFTTSMLRIDLHYLEFAEILGFVRCNGPACLLCRLGRQRDSRDLLPIYDVLDRAVAVLPISPSLRPQALRPQLVPALRRMAGGEGPLLLILRKDGNARFLVSARPLPEGAADGAGVIEDFRARFDAGLVDLASPFQRLADEDMAAIAEVGALMAAKGIAI